jgi:O-antigen/teichoic acid export membrane protein
MRAKALKGGRWMMIESVGVQVMSFLVTAVLARWFLDEADYGAIAAVTVAAGLLGLLADTGFSVSLIQRDTVSDDRVSSLFWAGAGLGAVLGIIVALLAGPIANSMSQPEIAPLIVLTSTQIVAAVVSSIPEALLLRKLQFKKAAVVSIASFSVYPPIAIGLAYFFDAGPWAVIIGQAVRPIAKTLLGMYSARWHPRLVMKWALVKEDFGINGGYLVVSIAGFLTKNVDYWIISRHLGPEALGFYYMAFLIPTLVRQRLTWAVGRVLLPAMSRVRQDVDRAERAFLDSSRLIALISLPALVGLALVARPAISVLVGDKWLTAAETLPLLAVSAAADALSQVTMQAFVADGRPIRVLWFAGPRVVALAGLLYVAVDMDGTLVGVAWAVLAASILNLLLAHCVAVWKLDIPFSKIMRAYGPVMIPLAAMIITVTSAVGWLGSMNAAAFVSLVVGILVGTMSYLGAGFLVSRPTFGRLLIDARAFLGKGQGSEPVA